MKLSWLAVAAGAVATTPALASDLTIKVTLPEIASNGGRPPLRPYVAIWLRKADNSFAGNLAVWYEIESRRQRGGPPPGGGMAPPGGGMGPPGAAPGGAPGFGGPPRREENPKTPGGARWLNEVRQWWADSGNTLQFPVDGVTSASRAVGTHELTFVGTDPKLAQLPPGKYQLMVEASREHGGNELVSIPFTWPATTAQNAKTAGKTELGAVELTIKP